ncbi:MAG: HDOD domain-containing protein, partial [Candidatus Cloacimonetes bacterium]|nr:HDOD domain-containing protein [Candidatus Cloacimonadota bacterium]
MNKPKQTIKTRLIELSRSDKSTMAKTNLLVELNGKIAKPDSDAKEIAEVIKREPNITAAVLRVTNSSAFGQIRRVTDVHRAVTILGLSNLQRIFTAEVLRSAFQIEDRVLWENLWRHSLGVAVAARNISKYVNPQWSESLFTAGLLHDLGSFIIFKYLPKETRAIKKYLEKAPNKMLLEAEIDILGLTHAQIGAIFTKEWNFPPMIVDCVMQHHFIGKSLHKEMIAVVTLANNLAKGMELGASLNLLVEPMPNWVWAMLPIPENEYVNLIESIYRDYEEII